MPIPIASWTWGAALETAPRETTYYHAVAGPEALLAWYRGTGLRPFLEALAGDEERRNFERKVLDRYIEAYPRRPGGRVLFPFARLFFVAYR